MFRGISWRHFDFWLLGVIVFAIAFGVAAISSAVAGNADIVNSPSRQFYFALFGLLVVFLIASVDYHYWTALFRPMYAVMMILLIFLFFSAQGIFGAARWFQLGTLFIQPTELAKIVAILILARYFEQTKDQPRNPKWILGGLAWLWGLTIWILLQPNLSNVVVMMVIWGAMVWINGIKLKQVFYFILAGVVLVVAAFPFLQQYQQDRVLTFLFPDPNASYGATYNVQQALIAIGSGGLFGQGFGHGTQTQLRFLKVRHTDFIFSAISEEFGLIGGLLVIGILLFIVFRCLRAARLAKDVTGAMIAYGVAILIFFQGAVNIGVNLRMIPVSGLPLPFISYGGSGLVSLMLGIGLVESVILRHRQMEF